MAALTCTYDARLGCRFKDILTGHMSDKQLYRPCTRILFMVKYVGARPTFFVLVGVEDRIIHL